jgi:(p)ppGpp synthase/HD superfamily hydrolase
MYKNEVEQIETATKWMMDKISQLQRKGHVNWHTIPYFYHCVQVSNLVFKFGAGTVNNQLASLCHDVKEENFSVTHEELVSATNEEAAAIVEELTYYPDRMSKEEYMASFATKSIDAVIIKVADRLCNVMDFKLTQPEYAFKYMNKANVLFDLVVQSRQDEVISKYGYETWRRIATAIDDLDRIITNAIGSKLVLN